jgi:hypothetical protein
LPDRSALFIFMSMTRRLLLALPFVIGACGARGARILPGGTGGGETTVARAASLAAHDPIPGEPDLVLRWTAIPREARDFRVVVHLHGFAGPSEPLRLVSGRLPGSGMVLPNSPPTLGMLIRGRPRPGRPGSFDWPVLARPGGLDAVIREAMAATGQPLPNPTRLVLTAHSGGGSGLATALDVAVAGGIRVDEAHFFDAIYGDPSRVLRWAAHRRAGESAGLPPGGLVAIARPGTSTEEPARRLAAGLARAGITGPRWRVLLTSASHNDVARLYGPSLLVDPAVPLSGVASA